MNKEIKYTLLFILLILTVSWTYALFVFSSPQTKDYFIFVMFFPALIAISLNFVRFRSIQLVLRPVFSRIKLTSLLFALFYPLLFIGLTAFLVNIFGLADYNGKNIENLFHFPSIVGLMIGFTLIFGEEYGWRGFLLQTLSDAKGRIFAAIIVGIVWALWHAPFIYGLACYAEMEYPLLLMLIQMGAVFIFSFPFAYSYFLSKNIIPPMLFHLIWNIINPIVLGNVYRNTQGIMEGNLLWINGEGLAGIILGLPFFIWYLRKHHKTANLIKN